MNSSFAEKLRTRHRFQSFSDQMVKISADINTSFELRIEKAGDFETSTFFYTEMIRSLEKNFDHLYAELTNNLLPLSLSLPLILNNQDKIFDLINNYLQNPYEDIAAGIQNVLKLISQLARDLQDDFYPHFNSIFKNLASLFSPKDTDFIEHFFNCISFLLHFLTRPLLRNIDDVINLFVESYFNYEQEFVRKLSAQCLSYLLRQVPTKKKASAHSSLFTRVQEFLSNPMNQIESSNDKVNLIEAHDEEEDDAEQNDDGQHYRIKIEKQELTNHEKIIQTLGYVLFFEIRNVQNSLFSNANSLIPIFLQTKEPFVLEAFLFMIEKLSKHLNISTAQNYLNSLSDELPQVNSVLCFKVFLIFMGNEKRQCLINNSDILFHILSQCESECPTDILCQFLVKLNDFPISEDRYDFISSVITSLLLKSIKTEYDQSLNTLNDKKIVDCNENFDVHFLLNSLSQCKKLQEISASKIVEFSNENFDIVLPYLYDIFSWADPPSSCIPEELVDKANKLITTSRETVVPLFVFLYNQKTYEIMKSLKQLTINEYGVLFSLMPKFQPEELLQQPQTFIDYLLNSNLMESEEALKILYELLFACKQFSPEWMNIRSQMFLTLFDRLNFNTPNFTVQAIDSSILSLFIDKNRANQLWTGEESIIHATEAVLNQQEPNTLTSLRSGESLIESLSSRIQDMSDVDRLLNASFAFARCGYAKFRERDTKLIGEIIKFDSQKFGPMVSDELKKTFPWSKNDSNDHLFAETLFKAIQYAKYISQDVVDLIVNYVHFDSSSHTEVVKTKTFLLDVLTGISRNPSYNETIEKVGYEFLKSSNSQIRQSAFNLIFNIKITGNRSLNEQQRDKIRTYLEPFVNGENKGSFTTFTDFLSTYEFLRPFISSLVVSLSIGAVRDLLSEKSRNKNKSRSIASAILQSLSYFAPDEVSPLILSFLVDNPTAADIRKFPKFFIPLISHIPRHLEGFLPDISDYLLKALKQAKKDSLDMKNAMTACSLFFESYPNYSEFANGCLTELDKTLSSTQQPPIRLTTAISIQFPELFSEHAETVNEIMNKLREHTTSDIIDIITRIILHIPDRHQEIIESYKLILKKSKLFKQELIWKSFTNFLAIMKDYFATPEFIDLLVIFMMNYQHIEAIQIAHGLPLTSEQFSELSKLIAYPLSPEFRESLIPLIAEHLDEGYGDAFIQLNQDDWSQKTITYKSLDSAGNFSFIFALQSFADLQLNDFSLRSAAVGFIARVIERTPSIVEEYVLPAIKFHVRKGRSRIPPNELLILLNTIVKTIPDIELRGITKLSQEQFFLQLGSFDQSIRESALRKFTEFVDLYDDWDVDEVSDIIFPLISQFSTTNGIENALSSLCKYTKKETLDRFLHRLVKTIMSGSTIHLLVALCKAQVFPAESVSPQLLNIITDNKKPPNLQLRLIPALLSVNKSREVIHAIVKAIGPKLSSEKDDHRKLAQQSLTELIKSMEPADYFILYQDLRRFLNEGRKIPVLFVSLHNLLENAKRDPEIKEGPFDSFIKLFSEVLLNDIFGPMGEMRLQKAKDIPEAKKCVSIESFQYLAKLVTFHQSSTPNAKDMIDTILSEFEKLRTKPQEKGAKSLIESLSRGFVENETVDAKSLVDLIFYLLDVSDTIKKKEQEKREKSEKIVYGQKYEEDFLIEKPIRSQTENSSEISKTLGNNYLVSFMAVRLLWIFFQKDLFDIEDKQQVELLEYLLERLWEFIKNAKDNDTLVVSLSILEHYIKLPSFYKFLPDVLSFLTFTISRLRTASDQFGQSVFRLLTQVLITFDKLKLPTDFTRALVTFCGGQLEVHDSCDQIFDTLKLVMNRRKDIPEIYDLAQPALELVIRAFSSQVRKRAAQFVASFMSIYKVSSKQFKKLLQFALDNLASSKATARKSLLIFLKHLIKECPMENVLDQYTELILAYLGTRIANELDENILPKLRKVIGLLLKSVTNSRFLSMWNLMIKWSSTNGKIVRTGLLLLAICIEYCAAAMVDLFEPLQQVVDVHINSESFKVKIAATELHRQIVIASSEIGFTPNLLTTQKILELLSQRETVQTGCELLHWYLSEYMELFNPSEDDLINISESLISVVVSWHGSINEASEALTLTLNNLQVPQDVGLFFEKNHQVIYSIFNELGISAASKTIIVMMRIFVQVIIQRECDNHDSLYQVLLFIRTASLSVDGNEDNQNKKKVQDELKEKIEKALELMRHNVDVDLFTQTWTRILEEEKARKEKEELDRQIEAELDPEGYKQRLHKEREKKKEEERRKRYLQSDEQGTLHPFDADGKKVESVPLAPEFR